MGQEARGADSAHPNAADADPADGDGQLPGACPGGVGASRRWRGRRFGWIERWRKRCWRER